MFFYLFYNNNNNNKNNNSNNNNNNNNNNVLFRFIQGSSVRAQDPNPRNLHVDNPARHDDTRLTNSSIGGQDNPSSSINLPLSGEAVAANGVVANQTPNTNTVFLAFPNDSHVLSNSSDTSKQEMPLLLSVFETSRAVISNPQKQDFQEKLEAVGAGKSTAGNGRAPEQSSPKPLDKLDELNLVKAQFLEQIFNPEQASKDKASRDGDRSLNEGQGADHSVPLHVSLSNDQITQVGILPGNQTLQGEQTKTTNEMESETTSLLSGNGIHLSIRKRPGIVEEFAPHRNAESTTSPQQPLSEDEPNQPHLMSSFGDSLTKTQSGEATNSQSGAMKLEPSANTQGVQKPPSSVPNAGNDGPQLSGDKVTTESKASEDAKTNKDHSSPDAAVDKSALSATVAEAGHAQQGEKLSPADSAEGSAVMSETKPAVPTQQEKQHGETSVPESPGAPSSGEGAPTRDDNHGREEEGLPIPTDEQQQQQQQQHPISGSTYEASGQGNGDVDPATRDQKQPPPPPSQQPQGDGEPEEKEDPDSNSRENVLRNLGIFIGPPRPAREQKTLDSRDQLPWARGQRIMRRSDHPPHGHHSVAHPG